MANLFEQIRKANELRQKMKKVQKELADAQVPYENGGLRIVATGDLSIKSIEILDPSILNPANAEKVQRLFQDNINKALKLAREVAESKMKEVAGGMDLGNMFK